MTLTSEAYSGASDVVIRVEGLGKSYALHHEKAERYTALRDVVARQARAAGRLLNPFTLAGQLRKAQREAAAERAGSEEEFWALKDVSFEIRRGERVGIIGRNGAGKSTLLKILSRITEPTTGRVEIRGRVASLLEVGTGFHPELTGRENIYLNGAILGMTRREIRSKFEEIVDFAEVEKFLDTPVKRYSSGMYVRLAFAVAAHLEPEILVVDEVLAVGDAAFQQKSFGKMSKVTKEENKTLLFVSHQLHSVAALCERVIWLKDGIVQSDKNSSNCINDYILDISESEPLEDLSMVKDREGGHSFQFTKIAVSSITSDGCQPGLTSGSHCRFEIHYKSSMPCKELHLGLAVQNLNGVDLMTFSTRYTGKTLQIEPGEGTVSCDVDCLSVKDGKYGIRLFASEGNDTLDWIKSGIIIPINPGNLLPSRSLGTQLPDTVIVSHSWGLK